MLVSIKLSWFYLACIVILVIGGVWLHATCAESTDKQQETSDSYEEVETKWRTKYKKLLKTKRIVIPVPIYRTTECETELDSCASALDGIKRWCDPYCKQKLSECLETLQMARESNLNDCYCHHWRL